MILIRGNGNSNYTSTHIAKKSRVRFVANKYCKNDQCAVFQNYVGYQSTIFWRKRNTTKYSKFNLLLINIANLIKVRFDDAKQKIYTRDQSKTKHSKFNLLYSMYVINTAKLIKLKSIHVKGSIFLKKKSKYEFLLTEKFRL
jgi:hypothetical protein